MENSNDKIFVKDYICDIDIGVFNSEFGVKQRVKFNVVLEIEKIRNLVNDSVDEILSYEIIIDAINYEIRSKRFNLLETLAEQIAKRCLGEKVSKRVFVRIEKLDRIVGSLGIEIVRDKHSWK